MILQTTFVVGHIYEKLLTGGFVEQLQKSVKQLSPVY